MPRRPGGGVTVYLVGAGPGDPGLLTVRGREVLERAQVVVFDRLSVASLLELAPPDAERISVGKRPGHQTMPQAEINQLLVERGRAGQEVVRLKGGDPFVFARGGEEAAALLDAGVPFEVVPGITAAVAVPAYAGVPVTMRHSSTSFTVVTGHEDPTKAIQVDWDAVARVGGTIVILMGVARMGAIAERLMAAGRPPDTPVAAVRWGTRPEQSTVRTTLGEVGSAPLEPPATIVVGAVAGMDLGWFERRPLLGRRVVVTRPADQSAALVEGLRAAGAEAVVVPAIAVMPPVDGGAALRGAVADLGRYRWVVLTSANAVDALFAEVRDARALGDVLVAAVGPATAAALESRGVVADLVPDRFVAESLVEAFPEPPGAGGRVLFPRSAQAGDTVVKGLGAAGWEVTAVDAYRTVPAEIGPADLERVAGADAVTFTSGSAVEGLEAACGVDGLPPVVVCIGPVTAEACRAHGIEVTAVAEPHTSAGLVAALVAALP